MKLPKLILNVFFLLSLIAFNQCKKDNRTPLEQLPPETQTGANTFGCLVDGQVFIPKGDPFGGPIKKAQYQYINGGYYFGISGTRSNTDGITGISIFSDSSTELTTQTISLTDFNRKGLYYGSFFIIANTNIVQYRTNHLHTGEIKITKFDISNQIVSGTFWFDAIDTTTGKIVQIRMGRFDMPYVR